MFSRSRFRDGQRPFRSAQRVSAAPSLQWRRLTASRRPLCLGWPMGLIVVTLQLNGCNSGSTASRPSNAPGVRKAEDGPLKITAVTPPMGTVEGETVALIRGTGFTPGMTVLFGGAEAKEV